MVPPIRREAANHFWNSKHVTAQLNRSQCLWIPFPKEVPTSLHLYTRKTNLKLYLAMLRDKNRHAWRSDYVQARHHTLRRTPANRLPVAAAKGRGSVCVYTAEWRCCWRVFWNSWGGNLSLEVVMVMRNRYVKWDGKWFLRVGIKSYFQLVK